MNLYLPDSERHLLIPEKAKILAEDPSKLDIVPQGNQKDFVVPAIVEHGIRDLYAWGQSTDLHKEPADYAVFAYAQLYLENQDIVSLGYIAHNPHFAHGIGLCKDWYDNRIVPFLRNRGFKFITLSPMVSLTPPGKPIDYRPYWEERGAVPKERLPPELLAKYDFPKEDNYVHVIANL